MRRHGWLGLLICVLAATLLYAETGRLGKHTVWVVPWDCREPVRVRTGDVIEVWTRPLPLILENLDARFRASKTGQGVEYIGETLPHKEGTMERLFFFRAFEAGPATLTVELVNKDGTVRETWTYQVEVAAEDASDKS